MLAIVDSICSDKNSRQSVNKYGDRESSCLIPLEGEKNYVGVLFTKIAKEDEEIQDMIISTTFLGTFM